LGSFKRLEQLTHDSQAEGGWAFYEAEISTQFVFRVVRRKKLKRLPFNHANFVRDAWFDLI
jgi:hypothetical protein